MGKKFSLILFLIFIFSNVIFAQSAPQISASLIKKASQVKTLARTAADIQDETVDVIFYPKDADADNIDTSFFRSRNIEYIKSRNFLSAKIPASLVPLLDTIGGVRHIDLNVKARALENVSEGRDAVNASVYTYNNIGGAGVKIAVIDVGFMYYDYLQSTGELSSNLVTRDFTRSGNPSINALFETEPHGSACAEIIYDFVPDAQMYLLKIDDLPSIQNAFDYCKSEGIKIASCSIGFMEGFWCDGTGEAAQTASEAYNDGVLPVFAAGNEARLSWFGMFNGNSDGWMVFPGGRDYLEIYVYARGNVYLMWDDFNDRNKEYVLSMYDNTGAVLIDSSAWLAGDRPSVYVSAGNIGRRVRIKVKKENAYADVNIRLCFEGYYINSSEIISESSLSSPADSREAIAVGAVSVSNWNNGPIDNYSSHGPTRATSILPQAQKPDIVGPSYVTTASYGRRGFNGTSSAAPHIAGSAALLLSLDNSMTTGRLKEKTLSYYRQIASSPDNIYGMGKLVLGTDMISGNTDAGNIVCYPNPSSISKNRHINITNLPANTTQIDINVYTVTGEFVKSFNSSDLRSKNGRMTIEWDLRNQSGSKIAPGVYFVTVDTPLNKQKVKKIAVQK